MAEPKDSPAVRSMEIEQAKQRDRASKGALETGLEDTFPASDAVSVTSTAVPTGRADVDEADQARHQPEHKEEFPLVEEALRSTGEGRRSEDGVDVSREGLRALRRDADHVAETASEVASGAKSLAKAQARSFMNDVENKIREQPIAAVAIVATIAFVFGATR
jgi:ElaB/YqjD/DUF883 family membrane-anchored ribosome-binding protein